MPRMSEAAMKKESHYFCKKCGTQNDIDFRSTILEHLGMLKRSVLNYLEVKVNDVPKRIAALADLIRLSDMLEMFDQEEKKRGRPKKRP